ncbi:UTP--glucose-1-phosphate uridylyltransferase [Aerococcus kribbianus]|uniref:UTP--glucose-1-phosphate uridylyltransferase n=1 Tax=Aerococcus kribbianus TaxID=2999064 RepID=A0A9X3FNL5_9LACT|nr:MULTISPECIES: UTP--glucose-1-phosphate uridylyltransferase [unclassified Aerococcus]MCZ0717781.1 UTP--glucose-1-phosphate uridylyltransferase [Aerococcus sp. YH-aer221]MCZ0726068.1 UTP--glucose-1-phosphate uridylyltransferase [Aerococcus sp. YH-aer222]
MKPIKKAVIPAAGLGTRFLPASKAMAKEIIPIMDKPTIQFIVEEAVAAGIEEILIITGRNKRSIEDHFDANYELEDNLIAKGKKAMLEMVESTSHYNIQFRRQHYPNGLGAAVLEAKSFVQDEPFLLLLGDDIMVSDEDTALSKALIAQAESTGQMQIASQTVPSQDVSQYGIITTEKAGDLERVTRLVEKPQTNQVSSNKAICGRYILNPEIFAVLESLPANDQSGEIELTDALNILAQEQTIYDFDYQGKWYEVGEPLGLVKASIQYALKHPETSQSFKDYLQREIIPRLKADDSQK